jgi:hypothetical protein
MVKKLICLMLIFLFVVPAVFGAEKFVRKYSKGIDLTTAQTEVRAGRYTIRADMSRPARPFSELVFRFFIEEGGKAVEISSGEVRFNMSMDMGLYKTRLQKAASGYTAKVTLPKCIFGGERWYVKLTFEDKGFTGEKVFLFDMAEK